MKERIGKKRKEQDRGSNAWTASSQKTQEGGNTQNVKITAIGRKHLSRCHSSDLKIDSKKRKESLFIILKKRVSFFWWHVWKKIQKRVFFESTFKFHGIAFNSRHKFFEKKYLQIIVEQGLFVYFYLIRVTVTWFYGLSAVFIGWFVFSNVIICHWNAIQSFYVIRARNYHLPDNNSLYVTEANN